ncbi:PAS/PAC sensor hybrid histidine kinase [Crinalium epipsammum PCC 9333]|uniref:Circadian input-output histidine kinase CikA n=1 Tax=Crinalium epipsammum PCC 9333 TaxID=1173022 RepID=K9W6D9_9CYAN|nr:response regulator [Crinalium epipsammum]AFZ15374.1 PAS/PAC sensor hybrid histidine kinase [Crinalium epipsammum PCC 9333]
MQIEPKVNILLVDDYPENLLTLEAILSGLNQNLVRASSGEEALRCILHQDFAVVLLDVQMPGLDGFETATMIRQRMRSQHTPIIFLTAFHSNDNFIYKGYSLGAVDYLLKPLDPEILISKVTVFVDLFKKTAEIKRQAAQLESVNAELNESKQTLQDFLDNANDLIQILSLDGRFTYVNRTWQQTLGYSLEEISNLTYFDIIHPAHRSNLEFVIKAIQLNKENCIIDTKFITKDGKELEVEGNLNCRFEENKPIAIRCIFRDISERKQAEETRAQFAREQAARQQAEAANRMKDEFLAVLSHELRTPLNSMLGWVRLLLTRNYDQKATNQALQTIERNAKLQAQLIEDILDVSRIIQGKLQIHLHPTNLVAVIDAAVDAVRPNAETKAIKLEAIYNDIPANSSVLVRGDFARLQQICWNLLTNAIKFSPQGGKVQITLKLLERNFVQIQITDNGIGISKEFLPHIFERFRQADSTSTRSQGGLGLGLAIVRHIVELHGGSIKAESEGENKGSTFTVTLSLLSNKIEENNGKAISAKSDNELNSNISIKLNELHILVVDDEPDALNLLTVVFAEYGAKVTTAASASQAIELIKSLQPDILISDIGMPNEDGYSLVKKVRELESQQAREIPAIALTAYVTKEDNKQAISSGFQMHLSKPVDTNALITAVAKLAGKMPMINQK